VKKIFFVAFFFTQYICVELVNAQTMDKTDTLKEVIVSAYGNNRTRQKTAGSIGILNSTDFRLAAGYSLVPVLNHLPGLQMEERSPGSYRISIRGSSIRSPYGVRNIKVYLDNFSLTDAGGGTYINSLDEETIGAAEVIKGPASSVYGAGTGGVILLKTFSDAGLGVHANAYTREGSYGLRSVGVHASSVNANNSSSLFLSDLRSTGYRANTAMERQVVHYHGTMKAGTRDELGITAFYSSLFYQTPGGLTLSEYDSNPRQARPATKTTPSASAQHATIYTKQVFLGVSNRVEFNGSWWDESTASLSDVQFKNPYITNYERKVEQNYALRSVLHFLNPVFGRNLHAQAGIEYMNYFSPDRDYRNKGGSPDSITRDDEIRNTQFTAFLQAELELPFSLIATAGMSLNNVHYEVFRLSQKVPGLLDRPFKTVASPRFSLLKVINDQLSVYSSINFGYSPPSNQETLSATGVFNSDLQPEKALTWEAGIKGAHLAQGRLDFELTAFLNHITQTIVRRTNAAAQEYFINEGTTVQKGLELSSYFNILKAKKGPVQRLSFRAAATASNFQFGKQGPNSVVTAGRPLTGSAPYIADAGVRLDTYGDLGLAIDVRYSDRIPLADVGTIKAGPYTVVKSRLTFNPTIGRVKIEAFAGVDNPFNRKYSLGNDLNAALGRYYNAAPLQNFILGLKIGY